MKICLIGDFSQNTDEGYKNFCHSLSHWLEDVQIDVRRLNIKHIYSPVFWEELTFYQAQIIHLITQPTWSSLLFSSLIRRIYPSTRIVLSALKPEKFFQNRRMMTFHHWLLKVARPHLVMVQSQAARRWFELNGLNAICIPNGVDTSRFHPVNSEVKIQLRDKYSVETNVPVALHVGHLIRKRNLDALRNIPSERVQVVVVASTYMRVDRKLLGRLREAGIRLIIGYHPNIEEWYQLSDMYIFPVLTGDTLSMPLSVLEAMACSLPVITTPFPGLQEYFQEGNGLFYLNSASDLPLLFSKASADGIIPRTGEMVKDFSWELIAAQIQTFYTKLLSSSCPQ